jgi:hypothetical protein
VEEQLPGRSNDAGERDGVEEHRARERGPVGERSAYRDARWKIAAGAAMVMDAQLRKRGEWSESAASW